MAVFTIFLLLCSWAAITAFQESASRRASATRLLVAADFTRAATLTIEAELNRTLRTAIVAAMHEVGARGGSEEDVEALARSALNERIALGWTYPNLIPTVPRADENSLVFDWRPDGSVRARGHLDARLEHRLGPRVYGLKLDTIAFERFARLRYIAENLVAPRALIEPEVLVRELNENFACEGIRLEIENLEGMIAIKVIDSFAGRVVVV